MCRMRASGALCLVDPYISSELEQSAPPQGSTRHLTIPESRLGRVGCSTKTAATSYGPPPIPSGPHHRLAQEPEHIPSSTDADGVLLIASALRVP